MNLLIHAANLVAAVSPVRETFGLRRKLFIWGGIRIGPRTRILHRVCFYDRYTSIGSETWIGEGCVFHSTINGAIVVGDRVDFAPGCHVVSGTHEIGEHARRAGAGTGGKISIGSGCWIGTGAVILAGAEIGAGSIVAAGAVVRAGTYPEDVLLAGVPATVKRVLTAPQDRTK